MNLNWSPDSKLLLVGCEDATSRVFAAEWIKGFFAYSLGSHKSPVVGCFFASLISPDCYTVSRDGAVHFWTCSKSLNEFEIYERGAHLHATDDLEDERDAKTQNKNNEVKAVYPNLDVKYTRAAKHRVAVSDQSVDVVCCDYHCKTKLIVFGLSDGEFHLYELPDFIQIQSLSIDSSHPITSIRFNKTGDWIGIASEVLGQLLVWEWQSESYILKQQSHTSRHVVTTASFSPDEQSVVTGGNDGKVKLWQTKTSFCIVTFSEHSSAVSSVIYSQSGKIVLSASLDGTVRAFDLKRYRNFKTLTSPRPAQFTALACDVSVDIVASCAVDMFDIFVWSMKTGTILEILSGHTSAITSLQFTPITSNLVTVSLDGYVRSWNVSDSKGGAESLLIGHEVMALSVSPSGAEAAISTSKANLQIIDTVNFEVRDVIDCRHDLGIGRGVKDQTTAKSAAQSRTFTSLCYSPDGAYLLAAGHSKYVCLYFIRQSLLVQKFAISQNLSIDRMNEMLDRRKMTEFGNKDLIDSGVAQDGKGKEGAIPLPGVKNLDLGQRSFKAEIKVDQIQFSPSGRNWLAACTEGCVLYSLDNETLFDPYQLTSDISPQTTKERLAEKKYQIALIYSLKLKDLELTKQVLETIPADQVDSLVSLLPTLYVFQLVGFLANRILVTHLIEFYLMWCKAILLFHRDAIKELMPKNELTAFNKALIARYEELKTICEPVGSALDYFIAVMSLGSMKLTDKNRSSDVINNAENIDDVMDAFDDDDDDDLVDDNSEDSGNMSDKSSS